MAAPSLFAWSNRVQKQQRVNLEEEQDDDDHDNDNDLTPTDNNEYEMTLFSSSTNTNTTTTTTTTTDKKQVLLSKDSTTTTTTMNSAEEKAGIFRNNNDCNKKYDAIISHDNNNNNMHCTPTKKKKKTGSSRLPSLLVTRITAIASLGGILFGYDMGVIAGALPQLATSFDLNDSQQELVVSILYVGGGLGAAVGGTLCDALGRKVSILYTDVIFMVGALLLATAPALWQVVLGRFIVGFGIAVSGIADVSYLHEIAPTQWRGAIVSVNEACISLGFLMAFCIGVILAEENTAATNSGWRIMFGLAGILAAIQFLGMLSMPESPIWLQQKGRLEEAKRVYDYIHYSSRRQRADQYHCADHSNSNNEDDDDDNNIISGNDIIASADGTETTTTIEENDDNDGIVSSSGGAQNNYFALYSRQIWIALFLSMTQQFCGQTNVLNYAPIIFTDLDNNNTVDAKDDTVGDDYHSYPEDNDDDSFYSSHKTRVMIFIGLVKFIVTVLVIWKIEYLGRRFLLLTGMTTISLGLLFVTLAFSMTTTSSSWAFSLTTIGILMVVCGYSMSFGPLTWLLTSELFPTHIRGRALGCSTIVTYGCAALVSSTFLSAQTLLGGTNRVFALYLIITVVGIVFVYLAIPDTGHGQTTEEIHSSILQMTWWRQRNSYKQEQQERSLYDHNNASNNNGNNNPSTTIRCTPPAPQQEEIPELL